MTLMEVSPFVIFLPDPNYFFQQNQGRFVPFAPASSGRSQQQPGSYQEQTLYVNQPGQSNGPVPQPSNVAESPFFQFPFSVSYGRLFYGGRKEKSAVVDEPIF